MAALGVDPGLCFPAAAIFSDGGVLLASATLTIGRELRGGQRLATIRRELSLFAAPWGPITSAAIEGPSLNSTHREYDLGEASGVIRSWTYETHGVEMQVVEPARLKLYATGGGNASKGRVIAYVVQNHKPTLDPSADDEADAVVLAHMAHSLSHATRPQTRAQAEVLRDLKASHTPVPRGRSRLAGRSNNL